MRMEDPIPQFMHVIGKARQSNIAYLHLVESRLDGDGGAIGNDSLDFAFRLWDGPLLIAGGYTPQHALELVDEKIPDQEVMVMFGRLFVSNPDLVYRISKDLELAAYDRGTFYSPKTAAGYTDYAFSREYLESAAA
jgi:NADPH2 dehydrogenase